MNKDEFVETFSGNLTDGSALVFLGAGISRSAGYPSWIGLVQIMAKELKLDLTNETDLAGVVQFFLNRKTRGRLTEIIDSKIGVELQIPEILNTLAKLPINEIWTTNYDTLIERAWAKNLRGYRVKSENSDLTSAVNHPNSVIYKMHGTVEHSARAIIAKSDFELYRNNRRGFLQILIGQFINRNFLFLGLSFSDPNLAHLFAEIRRTFGDDVPSHYTIVRRPQWEDGPNADQIFDQARIRHEHWVDDLQNYGIRCVEVDEYEEIDQLLRKVESRLPQVSDPFKPFITRKILFVSSDENAVSNFDESVNPINAVLGSGDVVLLVSSTLADANAILQERKPNIVVIDIETNPIEGVLNFVERHREIRQLDNIVWAVYAKRNWKKDNIGILSKHNFGSRIQNYYSIEKRENVDEFTTELLDFLDHCHVDFALQFLDESVTRIQQAKSSKLTERQIHKFVQKASNSLSRINFDT